MAPDRGGRTASPLAPGVVAALADLPPPERAFASDNTAGAHPVVLDAMVAANDGHVTGYGDDPWTGALEAAFADLFGRPVGVALCFGGTGANVVALHTLCTRDSEIVCAADAHIAIDECGAPEHITGAQLAAYPWNAAGKVEPGQVHDAAARLGRIHIEERTDTPHVVSVTQATEVGTVYSEQELTAVVAAAHEHGMLVHVDGARLVNALAAWGYAPAELGAAGRALAATGVDVVSFGGTKAGLVGAEAVVFLDPARAEGVGSRRKQATQTASKMRFLAAQFLVGLEDGRMLAWAHHANTSARRLADGVTALPGVAAVYPVDTNGVFVTLPPAAIDPLAAWSHFYVWDRPRGLVRFVASWDTTDEDVDRMVAGVAAAVAAAGAEA